MTEIIKTPRTHALPFTPSERAQMRALRSSGRTYPGDLLSKKATRDLRERGCVRQLPAGDYEATAHGLSSLESDERMAMAPHGGWILL